MTATQERRRSTSSHAEFALSTAALVLAYVLTTLLLDVGLVDDAYIFLRYASNIWEGHGPVFNPGRPPVEGYTSPLWLAVLTVARVLPVDPVRSASWTGGLIGLLSVLVLLARGYRLAPGRRNERAHLPAWFLATNPFFVYWAWSGMEVPLATLVTLMAFFSVLDRMPGPGSMTTPGVWLALSGLVRLDLLCLVPVYALLLTWIHRRAPRLLLKRLTSLLVPLLLLVPHFLWRLHYYDAWLPNTYFAKAGVPGTVLLGGGTLYVLRFGLCLGPCLFVAYLVNGAERRRTGESVPFHERHIVQLLVLVWSVYLVVVGGDFFAFFRFFVPLLPLLALCLAPGPGGLLEPTALRTLKSGYAPVSIAGWMILVVAFNVFVFFLSDWRRAREEVQAASAWADVGRWFRENSAPDAAIATVVAGAIPYHAERTAYDLVGLTDRDIARYGNVYAEGFVGHQKYASDVVLERAPDYIVLHPTGWYEQPIVPRSKDWEWIHKGYAYALYDLVRRKDTWERYRYRSIRMENGKYLEFLAKTDE